MLSMGGICDRRELIPGAALDPPQVQGDEFEALGLAARASRSFFRAMTFLKLASAVSMRTPSVM